MTATNTRPAPAPVSQRPFPIIAALTAAAVAFAAYPILRGYATETGTEGARLYADPSWLIAHVLGMLGFVLVALSMRSLDRRIGILATTGTALLLPYYGAEAFGLHALGRYAVDTGDTAALAVADLFRYEAVAITTFGLGLLFVAAAGVLLIIRGGRTATGRIGAILAGLGLATYLPQFFAPQAGRITHGVVLAIGLLLLAISTRSAEPSDSVR